MIRFLIIFIITTIITSCGIKKIKEEEPNNTKWQSQIINTPVTLIGKLDQKDIDYFKFIVQDESTNSMDISLLTKNPNTIKINLYYQNILIKSTYLQKSSFNDGENLITFKNILRKKGLYCIRLIKNRKEYDEAKYSLNIKLNSFNKNIEQEPNDKLLEANYINITNGYIKGYYNPSWNLAIKEKHYTESDWYKFNTTDKSNILAIEITSIPGTDPVIEIYNKLGFLIKRADSMGIDEPEILKNFGIFDSGEYYIKIFTKKEYQNDKMPYQLYLNLSPINSQFELEPNDSLNQATSIKDKINGYINPVSDIDWYTFNVKQDKAILNTSITPLNNVDLKIDFFNQIGEKIYSLDYAKRNEAEVIPNLLLKKGKYYITVTDKKNKYQNYLDYYTMTIKLNPYLNTYEYEPNNSFKEAITFNINNSYKGYLSPGIDKDYYTFSLDDKTTLKFDISPVPQINPVIEIYDAQKNIIKTINNKSRDEGESETITLNSGIYYVILKDADNKNNFYENYIFSIFER